MQKYIKIFRVFITAFSRSNNFLPSFHFFNYIRYFATANDKNRNTRKNYILLLQNIKTGILWYFAIKRDKINNSISP